MYSHNRKSLKETEVELVSAEATKSDGDELVDPCYDNISTANRVSE